MTEQNTGGKAQKKLYQNYPDSSAATFLSMAASGARLAAVLMAVGAVLMLVLIAAVMLSMRGHSGGLPLLWLLDEMDDELGLLIGLLAGAVVSGFVARLLSSRAGEMASAARSNRETQ